MYEVMMRGYNAYHSGLAFTMCPYKEGSSNWMSWTSGWIKAEELA